MALRLAQACAAEGSGLRPPSGLVLLSAALGPDAAPAASSIFHLPVWLLSLLRPLLRGGFAERALHEATRRGDTDVSRRLLARAAQAEGTTPMHAVAATMRQMAWVTSAEIDRVSAPTLLLCGEADRLTPPQFTSALRAALPEACGAEEVIVPLASHQVRQCRIALDCAALMRQGRLSAGDARGALRRQFGAARLFAPACVEEQQRAFGLRVSSCLTVRLSVTTSQPPAPRQWSTTTSPGEGQSIS